MLLFHLEFNVGHGYYTPSTRLLLLKWIINDVHYGSLIHPPLFIPSRRCFSFFPVDSSELPFGLLKSAGFHHPKNERHRLQQPKKKSQPWNVRFVLATCRSVDEIQPPKKTLYRLQNEIAMELSCLKRTSPFYRQFACAHGERGAGNKEIIWCSSNGSKSTLSPVPSLSCFCFLLIPLMLTFFPFYFYLLSSFTSK